MGASFTRTRFVVFLLGCQVFAVGAREDTGARWPAAAVPVEREGRILFVAPDDSEGGAYKLKEWAVKEGTVYDVGAVPNGAVRVSRTGRRLIIFNIGGGYYGDDPPERELTILVYEREAPGLPFGPPEAYVHTLQAEYVSGVIYDDATGKLYVNYTSGHH